MWKEGSIKVGNSIFHYWIKVYDVGSVYGINGGRISKLMLKCDGKIVCSYDRGWDVLPEVATQKQHTKFLFSPKTKKHNTSRALRLCSSLDLRVFFYCKK